MKGFLVRCAIAGAIIGGAAAATFQTISTFGPSTVGIAPAAAPVAAPAAAPAAAAPAVATQSTQAAVAAPARTPNPGPCVGFFHSALAHESQLVIGEGFGQVTRDVLMTTPGQEAAAIKAQCATLFPK